MTIEGNQTLFEVPIELKLEKSASGEGRRMVRGYASMEKMDQQGEIILQGGIDFSPLLKSGFLNYDHQTLTTVPGVRMPTIVGYPTKAEIRDKGLWVEGELLKSDDPNPQSEQLRLANELWEVGIALQKSGGQRSLAYSVEGGVIERKGNRIVKSVVRHLAITHKPVLAEATVELFAKSFFVACGNCDKQGICDLAECAKHAAMKKAMSTASAAPMMRENLDRGLSSVLYGPAECGHYDRQTGKFNDGINGAMEHLEKCQGLTKQQGIDFLRKLLNVAPHRPDVAALVATAGFGQQ